MVSNFKPSARGIRDTPIATRKRVSYTTASASKRHYYCSIRYDPTRVGTQHPCAGLPSDKLLRGIDLGSFGPAFRG